MSGDTTIKVTKETRDKLAQLAAERDTNIGALVGAYAEATPTASEIAAERERTRAVLQNFGIALDEHDLTEGERLWTELAAGNVDALRQARV